MRLIDADWIFSNLKQTVVVTGKENTEAVVKALEDYNNLIRNAPTIDAVPTDFHNKCMQVEIDKRMNMVEVVRCKECKYFAKYGKEIPNETGYYCTRPNQQSCNLVPDDYCSYGERKD